MGLSEIIVDELLKCSSMKDLSMLFHKQLSVSFSL